MAKLNISIGGKIEGSLTKSLRELNQSMTQLVAMNKQVADSLGRLSTTTKGNRQTITAAAGSYREAQQRLTAMGRAIREAENGFNSNDPAVRKNIAAYRALSAELKAFDKEMGLNYRNVGNYSSATGGLVGSLKQLALSYLSLQTAIQAFSYAFQKSMQLDAMRTSFGFIIDDSIDRINKLRKEADRLGVEFLTLTETNKKFIAAAKASNFSLEEADKIFNAVANAGAKLKLSNEQISGTFLAIEQMISKGTVSMEELRRQLGDRLPGAFALAAQAMGMTEAAFNKAVASGEIMAKDLLPKLATELNRVYENNPNEKIDSLQAAFNRWKNVLVEIVDNSNITEYFKGFIEVATQAVGRMTGVIKEGDYTIDTFKSLSAQFKSNQSALSSLISEYLTARSEISQTNLQSDKLYEINQKIAKILPESVTKWDAYGNAIEVSIDRVIALTNAQRELMDSLSDRAFEAAEKNVNKYIDTYEKAISRVNEMTRKGVSEMNLTEGAGGFYTGGQVVVSLSESIDEAGKAAKQAIPYLLTLQEAGRDLGKIGLGILQEAGLDERGAAMRQHTKETREAAEALKSFAEAEKEIRKARTKDAVNAVKEMFPNLEGNKSFENAIKARIKAIDDAEKASKRAAAEAERLAKEEERRQEAIARSIERQNDIREKANVHALDNDPIAKIEEEYRKMGRANAEEYQKQLENGLDPEKALENFNRALDALSAGKMARIGQVKAEQLKKETEEAIKAIPDAQLTLERRNNKDFVSLLKNRLNEEYRERLKYLNKEKQAGKKNKEEMLAEEKRLQLAYWKEIESISQIEDLNKVGIFGFSRAMKQAEVSFRRSISNINAGTKEGQAEIDRLIQLWDRFKELTERTVSQNTVDSFKEIGSEVDSIIKSFSSFDEGFGETLLGISRIVESINNITIAINDVFNSIGDGLKTAGASTGNGWVSIIGSIVGVVGSIWSAIEQSNRRAREEIEKTIQSVEDYYRAQEDGEFRYQALLRRRKTEEAYGRGGYHGTKNAIKQEQENLTELQKTYNSLFSEIQEGSYASSKAIDPYFTFWGKLKIRVKDVISYLKDMDFDELEKLDEKGLLAGEEKIKFDKLKQLREELKATGKSIEDLQLALDQMLTGTTVENLAAGFVDLFAQGKTSAKDMADYTEEVIKQAIKSTAIAKYATEFMQPLFEELAGQMDSGVFDISKLQSLARVGGENINQFLTMLEDALGVRLYDPLKEFSSGVSGQISRAITEDTALRLEGIWRGMFEMLKLGNEYTKQLLTHIGAITSGSERDYNTMMLSVMNSIDENTLRTADNTDLLVDIDETLSDIRLGINKVASNTEQQSARNLGI